MEGVIEIGKLKRIQVTLNKYIAKKFSNSDFRFDWDSNINFIKKGKGQLYPVIIKSDFCIEESKNLFNERLLLENKLKSFFLKDYNLSKPK
jgi:hypothetical protein